MKIFLLVLLLPVVILSQSGYGKVSGRILDEQTKLPVEGVNIFIANSLVGTSSNKNGYFEIDKIPPGRYNLIISHLSYENQSVSADIKKNTVLKLDLELQPKPIEFPEIGVSDKFDEEWWKNFEIFKAELLGKTWFAEGCEITNPFHINFSKNNDGVLFASCDVPIKIENRSLGYNVNYLLKHFEYKIGSLKYAGLPFFEEMNSDYAEDFVIWQENRLEAYMGSLRHFLRAISEFYTLITKGEEELKIILDYDNVTDEGVSFSYDQDMYLSKHGFSVFLNRLYSSAFGKRYSSKIFNVQSVIDSSENPNELLFSCDDRIEIQYFKEYDNLSYDPQISFLQLHADSVYFDKRGRYYDEFKIEVMGYMSKQRLAEMLPFEYEPSDSLIINTDFR